MFLPFCSLGSPAWLQSGQEQPRRNPHQDISALPCCCPVEVLMGGRVGSLSCRHTRAMEESERVSGVPQVLFPAPALHRVEQGWAQTSPLCFQFRTWLWAPTPSCDEHRGTGTLLGSTGSAAHEVFGCAVTETSHNPQGAEPWLCLAGQVYSDTPGPLPGIVAHSCSIQPSPGAASLPPAPQHVPGPPGAKTESVPWKINAAGSGKSPHPVRQGESERGKVTKIPS